MTIPTSSALAIIGAGPIGLEAAVWAASHNWDVVLFEKAAVGHHIRQWGHVRLFSPFQMNHSSWGPGLIARAFADLELPFESAYLTGREYVERYLEPLASLPEVRRRIFTGVEVVEIGKDRMAKKDSIGAAQRLEQSFRLLLSCDGREFVHHTRAVIDASGVYASPQRLGSGNIPAPGERAASRQSPESLEYGMLDVLGAGRRKFENKRILLVGGGHSAATALEGLAQLVESAPQTRVYWVNRSKHRTPYFLFRDDPLPYRDALNRLGNRLAAEPPPWLHYYGGSAVEEIVRRPNGRNHDAFEVVIDTAGGLVRMEVDRIAACVGFRPDNSLYRQLQVHECYATGGPIKLAAALLGGSADCLAQTPQGIEQLKNPEPNFFILGNKSYGTNTTFLMAHGINQVKEVMEDLASQPGDWR